MEHIPKVFMRLFQCRTQRIYEFHTDELRKRLAEDQSVDSTSKVLVSVMMSASLTFEVTDYDINNGDTHLHLTRACAEHNAELRKTNTAMCRNKHNAALLHNANQGVTTTAQEDHEHTDGDYKTQHRLDSLIPKQVGFYQSSEKFGNGLANEQTL